MTITQWIKSLKHIPHGAVLHVVGVTDKTLRYWAHVEGCPRLPNGHYDLAAVIRWLTVERFKERNEDNGDPQKGDTLDRLRRVKIESEQWDLDKKKGLHAPVADHVAQITGMARDARDAMEAIPRDLSDRLVGMAEREIEAALTEAIRGALQGLANNCRAKLRAAVSGDHDNA